MCIRDRDWRFTSEDRVDQVNWLRSVSADIVAGAGEGTAEELVEYAFGPEGWCMAAPEWFDDHDRSLLVQWVAQSL